MGQAKSTIFTDEELNDYQELTFFTKMEILLAHRRFSMLCPETEREEKNPSLPIEIVMDMPELTVNPFKDRICKLFSSEEGFISFEDFLDMMSVFSDKASKTVKTEYAFRIFDFDEDDMLSSDDLKEVLKRLVGDNELDEVDIEQIIDNVMAEADLDEDFFLAYAEFEHVIAKSPDFTNTFRIRL